MWLKLCSARRKIIQYAVLSVTSSRSTAINFGGYTLLMKMVLFKLNRGMHIAAITMLRVKCIIWRLLQRVVFHKDAGWKCANGHRVLQNLKNHYVLRGAYNMCTKSIQMVWTKAPLTRIKIRGFDNNVAFSCRHYKKKDGSRMVKCFVPVVSFQTH